MMDYFKMIVYMAMASIISQGAINMKGNGKKDSSMGMAYWNSLQEISIMEISKMTHMKDKVIILSNWQEYSIMLMVINMKVNGNKGKNMDKVK